MPPLRARSDFQIFLLCQLVGLVHQTARGTVHRHGFFHEDVDSGFDTGPKMRGAKARWSGKNDVSEVRFGEDLLKRVKPAEALFARDTKVFGATPSLFREKVSHSNNFAFDTDGFGRLQEILAGAPAAPTNPDDRNVHRFLCLGVKDGGKTHNGRRRGGGK